MRRRQGGAALESAGGGVHRRERGRGWRQAQEEAKFGERAQNMSGSSDGDNAKKIMADKHAAAMARKVATMVRLSSELVSNELDQFTIDVNGIRKPISKCTVKQIEAFADRCESEARRARAYLANRKPRK